MEHYDRLLERIDTVVQGLSVVTEKLSHVAQAQERMADHRERIVAIETRLDTHERMAGAIKTTLVVIVAAFAILMGIISPHITWR